METALYIIGAVIGFVLLCWGILAIVVWNVTRELTYSEMLSKLRGLRKTYNNFSAEQRETKTAKYVLKSIHFLEKKLKKIEAANGRSTRGGGNYKSELS